MADESIWLAALDYTLDAWTDPWGAKVWAYAVKDVVEVWPSGETHPYDDGYGDGDGYGVQACPIYETADGDRCYAIAPIDYCAHTAYRWFAPAGTPRSGFYERAENGRRCVLDGKPVQHEQQWCDTWGPLQIEVGQSSGPHH